MDWKQLESFRAVVQTRSFTKAADELFISQPTISAHVQALEKEYNARLILRSTKTVEITPMGWEVYRFACDVLEQQKNLRKRLEERLGSTLRVSAFTIPVAYMLPKALAAFREEYPEAEMFLEQNRSADTIDKLLYDQFDLGIVSIAPEDYRLAAEPIIRDRIVLITPADAEAARMKADGDIDWKQLTERWPMILRDGVTSHKFAADNCWEAIGIRENHRKICARTGNLEAIRAMVASGMGIAMISESAVQDLREQGKVLVFDLPCPEAERVLYLVYKKDYVPKAYQQELIRFLRGWFCSTETDEN